MIKISFTKDEWQKLGSDNGRLIKKAMSSLIEELRKQGETRKHLSDIEHIFTELGVLIVQNKLDFSAASEKLEEIARIVGLIGELGMVIEGVMMAMVNHLKNVLKLLSFPGHTSTELNEALHRAEQIRFRAYGRCARRIRKLRTALHMPNN